MTPDAFDAVIVGAGPAGSTAATLLARAGWSVALVEKIAFPRRKVCGECLAASNLPLLDALGVGAEVARAAGAPLRRVALMHREAVVGADLPTAAGRHPWGRALGRETLDALLLARARAAGATLLQPWSAQSVEGTAGDWRIVVRPAGAAAADAAPRTLRAALAIDAHGSWELLRVAACAGMTDAAAGDGNDGGNGADNSGGSSDNGSGNGDGRGIGVGIGHGDGGSGSSGDSGGRSSEGRHVAGAAPDATAGAGRPARRPADLLAFKANFRGLALADGVLPVLAFDGGYGGMVVAGDDVATVACCIRRDRLEALRRAAPGVRAGDAVEALLAAECAGVREALAGARREGPWLAAGPLAPGIRVRSDDAVLRIGNAAGEAHPILGEGLSMAMQSAWLLCARLLDPRAAHDARGAAGQAEAARGYAADWRRHFAPRIVVAAAFAHAAMRPAAARPLLALARAWPGLLGAGARLGGKVRCAVDATTMARVAADARPSAAAPGRAALAPTVQDPS